MQAMYIVLFISAFALSAMSLTNDSGMVEPEDATLNYLIYRDAVMKYAESHTLTNGTIATSGLPLPTSWRATSAWSNRVVGNVVYIWGELSPEGKRKLEKMTYCSQGFFYSQGYTTQAICTGTVGATLPVNLPTKTVVSIIEVI